MSAPTLAPPTFETLADVLERLGTIPPERIPFRPHPGTATERDLFTRPGGEKRLYELVEGVLVEKPMGYYEARLAIVLATLLEMYLAELDLGIVLGADATLRLAPGLVRLPDVSFVSWEHFPGRQLPAEPILDHAPDLAVEILSAGNTPAEMRRKVREYFEADVRLVWILDPPTRTVRVYTGPENWVQVDEAGTLDGGEVLPGFVLPVREWFRRAGQQSPE